MAEKKEYRSAIRSRRLIREAFLELLREKSFERITVTDIVNRADINRSTFYAHYPDVKGLVEEIENEIVDSSIALLSDLSYQSIFQDPMPFLQILTKPVMENYELYKLLGRSSFAMEQLEKLKNILVKKVMQSPEIPVQMRQQKGIEIRIHFFVGGIINTYQQWMQDNLDCSLDEITQQIAKLITGSLDTILDADWLA